MGKPHTSATVPQRSTADALAWCMRTVFILILWTGYSAAAHAVTSLALQGNDYQHIEIDLRPHWQTAVVVSKAPVVQAALAPQAIWDMADSQFAAPQAHPKLKLADNERVVARLSVPLQAQPYGLVVDIPMPRLDAVHLSYRYDSGPWTSAMAGDRVAMVQWPFANRHPVFVIPIQTGNLHIVWDIAHQGLVSTPVYLRGDAGFREERFTGALRSGALLGLAMVLALVGFGMASIFQRFDFVAVGLITLSVGLAVLCQGGTAGVYLGKTNAWFNDVSKFLTGMLFGALIPWTIAVSVAQRLHSKLVWNATIVWLVGGLLLTAILATTNTRLGQSTVLPAYLLASLLFATLIALGAVLRKQAHSVWVLVAVAFYSLGILAPLASYFGYADGPQSFMFSSLGFLTSSLLLLWVLTLQYRHGRMVMTRAQTSKTRDALTGLLNRYGFALVLDKNLKRMDTEKSHAAFLYISVSDVQTLHELYGGEGFEAGMVQIAAAVSSSVSVVDTVARIAPNVFAVMVMMPRDAKTANALAQKIISRNMSVASHSTPMAQTLRIAIAWLPLFGDNLADIERRASKALTKMDDGKRIVWIGGSYAQAMPPDMPDGMSQYHTPTSEQMLSDELPSLPGVINNIEREMLGGASEEQLRADASRYMKVMDAQEVRASAGHEKR
jgi:diguanylate cyclase (GGDEF)-like protein